MPVAQKRASAVRPTKSRRTQIPLRDQIRDTARDLFAREGYESVSMRRIGAEIGCSPMAIYRHYENKEELLLSICEETFGRMIQLLDKTRQTPGTRLEVLRRCVQTIVDFHLSHPNHYKVTFMTVMPPGPVAERKVAIGQHAMDRLRLGVRECAEAKGIEVDVEMAAQIIRVAIHGLASSLITTSKCYPWKDPQRMKEEVIATVTRQFE
ncbi:MAG TPA: TetR/AcrR family transcriptional regulator [Candidatus Angelobacter sp.]|jgi:AcrR family transcriptional regulator|nr:TetR/AcrR family transcriptional regulator [Candidatus Angelobacter sp.]